MRLAVYTIDLTVGCDGRILFGHYNTICPDLPVVPMSCYKCVNASSVV